MSISLEEYRNLLIAWWRENARAYPWRQERTAYRTVIAELMLRRTQADQVVPVYRLFLERYPSLAIAAAADPEEVRTLLYPLGLAWRAENIVAFLREAHRRHGNALPADIELWYALPGVGDYVGAAVVCFALGQAVPIIDTNVVRVLGRIFGLDTRGEARRRKTMRDMAQRALDPQHPAEYNYAVLDFAAKICTARKPHCEKCPFHLYDRCIYYQNMEEQNLVDNSEL